MDKRVMWTSNMQVGYDLLDDAHKSFVEIINEAYGFIFAQNIDAFEGVFVRCEQHAKKHFAEEEAVMKQIDFPDFESHQNSHKQFLSNLNDLKTSFHLALFPEAKLKIASRAVDYLKVWFLGHVLARDRIYKPYLVRLNKK